MADKRNPWEHQPGESPKLYRYFCHYRDLGPERSLNKAAALCGIATATIWQHSTKNKWTDRARAWDLYIESRIRESQASEIVEMRNRHAMAAKGFLELATKEAEALASQVRKADAELEKKRREGDPDATREPILAPVDIARLAKLGATLERLSRGEATAITKVESEIDTSRLTPDELRTFMELLDKVGITPNEEPSRAQQETPANVH